MKVVIVSGFFNPLHGGHLNMIEAASKMGDRLVVIVKNDKQQLIKKGQIILDEDNRQRLIAALRAVDEVVLSVDEDWSVSKSLELVAGTYQDTEILFANGGDRNSEEITPEAATCNKLGIQMVFGVGGDNKTDSSTRINAALTSM